MLTNRQTVKQINTTENFTSLCQGGKKIEFYFQCCDSHIPRLALFMTFSGLPQCGCELSITCTGTVRTEDTNDAIPNADVSSNGEELGQTDAQGFYSINIPRNRDRRYPIRYSISQRKKATIHQLTTSKNVLFPGHNHLLTTGADDPSLYRLGSSALVVSRWL